MSRATITSKGQTTIPADIRKFLNLRAGDKIEFISLENGKVMVVPVTKDVSALKGLLPRPDKYLSLEDMDEIIRRRGSEI